MDRDAEYEADQQQSETKVDAASTAVSAGYTRGGPTPKDRRRGVKHEENSDQEEEEDEPEEEEDNDEEEEEDEEPENDDNEVGTSLLY